MDYSTNGNSSPDEQVHTHGGDGKGRGRNKQRVSSIDVAKKAGVSQATVSRVFSPREKVSSDLREKVMRAANELNYQPNIFARGLNMSASRMIGIINPNFDGFFYTQALKHFSLELQKRNYTTMLLNIPEGVKLDDVMPIAFQYQVDGIITTSVSLSPDLVKRCLSFGVPVLQFNRYSLGLETSSVCLDNIRAGRDAAEYLVSYGHERIAYVSGDINSSTNRDRELGVKQSLEEHGQKLFARFIGDYSYASGTICAKQMMENSEIPDAVFCASDEMAFGLIDTLELSYGIQVPEDISVLGFNNSYLAGSSHYELSTIDQPVHRMVMTAVEVLFNNIEKQSNEMLIKMVPGKIIKRKSVMNRL